MQHFYLLMAFFLFLNILAGLLRVVIGPTRADRMLAAQLFSTTGSAICLLIAEALQMEGVRDTALVFVILSIMAVLAFVRRLSPKNTSEGS
ncbi:monovalent cation/H+ antiporter complex subunit F [Desulfopila inferna]|uniref:monovalent cation/H+ antiporter complex subunit F n=1 Tax=Desulfopila inferna TaxID=468528 RepID=UPI00196685DA|nr:monovalent cation/H+ antiporter complex subunit F [Desulfopila inferna]MBM9604858.1 multiple resistance and pH regulation protein F [Desulfopila inferna]